MISFLLLIAAAQEPLSPLVSDLNRCLQIAASTERATCLEERARRAVREDGERRQVARRKIERSFGLPGGTAALADHADAADDRRIDQVSGKISRVAQYGGTNRWSFQLADGSWWLISEPQTFGAPPVGRETTIKRGRFGALLATIGTQRPLRVQRLR